MSGNYFTFNFNLLDHPTAVWVFFGLVGTGGIGGIFVKVRRNWRPARQVDPEAIELREVIRAVGGSATLSTGNNTTTGSMEGSATPDAGNDAGPEATGTVESSITLDAASVAVLEAAELDVTSAVESSATLGPADGVDASN